MRRAILAAFISTAAVWPAAVSPAAASPVRRLATDVLSFASDGVRYAAWQRSQAGIVVLLDTKTGHRRQVRLATGCSLQDEDETGLPTVAALAGWFLISCGPSQDLLHASTAATIRLPPPGNWFVVGSRYVLGGGETALYDRKSGKVSYRRDGAHLALEQPQASIGRVCPRVRRIVLSYDASALSFGGNIAYRDDVFARARGSHGGVELDRCAGEPIILHARGTSEVCAGAPWNFDLRGGLFSWDTGCGDPDEQETHFAGRLYAYSLVTHRRESWTLPSLALSISTELSAEVVGHGTFGYSTHTASTVFWIATRTLTCEKLCGVQTADVYAATRSESPWR